MKSSEEELNRLLREIAELRNAYTLYAYYSEWQSNTINATSSLLLIVLLIL